MTNSKKENIEVELRGPLSKEKFLELENFFKNNGNFKSNKERVLIDYSTFLPEEGIEKRQKDIRLRVTNGVPEIVVKLGNWGGDENREEISVLAKEGNFDNLVKIFGILGLQKGMLCVRKSKVYDYQEIEFALVEVPDHSFYFEAEKVISREDDIENTRKEIREVCHGLGLDIFDEEGFFKYINTLNKEANEVFEFDNHHDTYFKDRFNL
ncbi:hypothetical protein COX95_02685 [bacterium CG_4_10_14_0_2_um_filter_33_32]|nr:MAG: hypothetical protein COS74_04465 [bacterium CG06_land_8_20_14_3_00_33_50]PIY85024.1 MAG: hypothetical protein COY76_04335 [bacterium CG_4_10_14_0_8_um_filter_33_57]PIZ85891.1 MAG: hypothetical protein COX95_02685 [bacterium CG_4_10_14_0_2_um_filter_33_32]PJA72584.1 MAG: hypothetical protein CO152_00675 [bacterium CG_4_9_14_3_um_filter_33_26]